jgi:ribonuclease P protein component
VGSRGAIAPPKEGPQASHCENAFETRGPLTQERFPRSYRLHSSAEFERVHESGQRRKLELLDVWWADNQAGHPRMGLIVPKFSSSVVARNRLRRRLRELWRRELVKVVPAWDVVIRTRSEAYRASFASLREALLTWRNRAG